MQTDAVQDLSPPNTHNLGPWLRKLQLEVTSTTPGELIKRVAHTNPSDSLKEPFRSNWFQLRPIYVHMHVCDSVGKGGEWPGYL